MKRPFTEMDNRARPPAGFPTQRPGAVRTRPTGFGQGYKGRLAVEDCVVHVFDLAQE